MGKAENGNLKQNPPRAEEKFFLCWFRWAQKPTNEVRSLTKYQSVEAVAGKLLVHLTPKSGTVAFRLHGAHTATL